MAAELLTEELRNVGKPAVLGIQQCDQKVAFVNSENGFFGIFRNNLGNLTQPNIE